MNTVILVLRFERKSNNCNDDLPFKSGTLNSSTLESDDLVIGAKFDVITTVRCYFLKLLLDPGIEISCVNKEKIFSRYRYVSFKRTYQIVRNKS
jgi:hypothetical protein